MRPQTGSEPASLETQNSDTLALVHLRFDYRWLRKRARRRFLDLDEVDFAYNAAARFTAIERHIDTSGGTLTARYGR